MFDTKIYDRLYDHFGSTDEGCRDNDYESDSSEVSQPRPLPTHPLEHNPNALTIDISGRVQISSRAHAENVLISYDGLASPPSELAHFDHAILDGGAVSGSRAQSRRITLDFVASVVDYPLISSLFPLGKKEVITVTRGNVTRKIEGYRDGPIEVTAQSAFATPIVSVSFLCPDTYFKNHVQISSGLNSVTGGLDYPIVSYPVHYGIIDDEGFAVLHNGGDYPAPFVLRTTRSSGDLTLRIDNVEVALIKGIGTLEPVVFDTARKILTIGGHKRLNALTGTFPTLPIGRSEIQLVGLPGSSTIEYAEIFEGV